MLYEVTQPGRSREILAKNEDEAVERFWEKVNDEDMDGSDQNVDIVKLCDTCKLKETCKQEDCEAYESEIPNEPEGIYTDCKGVKTLTEFKNWEEVIGAGWKFAGVQGTANKVIMTREGYVNEFWRE
jgi:hypothetical protein